MNRQAVGEAHKVSIGALPSLAGILLPKVVKELEDAVPDITVSI